LQAEVLEELLVVEAGPEGMFLEKLKFLLQVIL
jgi:hypothetical protein